MTNTVQDHPASKQEEWKLTVHDRCDRCGSQAYVKIVGVTGELLFCSHHYNKIINNPEGYKNMMAFMYAVLDERERLQENRTTGGHNQ